MKPPTNLFGTFHHAQCLLFSRHLLPTIIIIIIMIIIIGKENRKHTLYAWEIADHDAMLTLNPRFDESLFFIERFHSQTSSYVNILGKNAYVRKYFNSHRIGLVRQYGSCFIVFGQLIWPLCRYMKTLNNLWYVLYESGKKFWPQQSRQSTAKRIKSWWTSIP